MNLKLFLAALVSFVIPSCAEDYSQYEEAFYQINSTQYENIDGVFWQMNREIEKNNHTQEAVEFFKEAEGLYNSDLREKAHMELYDTRLTISNMPTLKIYDKKLKTTLKELKKEGSLSEEEIQETDKSLARLEFYKNKKARIYKVILFNIYSELEKYCFIGYRNRIMKRRIVDTIRVGETCKIVLKSYHFNKDFEHLEYDSIQFSIDGIEVKMNYILKITGEIGILTFVPNREGLYSIKGERNIVLNYNSRKKIANPFFRQKNVKK